MLCMKCGWENPDGAKFCNNCAAPLAPDDDSWTAEVNEEDLPSLNDMDEIAEDSIKDTPLQESYNRKPLPRGIWIAALGILLVGALAITLMLPTVRGFFKRTFTAPDKLLSDVYSGSTEHIFSTLDENRDSGSDKSFQSDIHLLLGDRVMNLLALFTNAENIKGLSDIGMQVDVSVQDSLLQSDYTLTMGDSEILTAQQYVDRDNQEMWLALPQLHQQALYMDFADSESFSVPELDYKKLEAVTQKYLQIFLSGFQNVEKTRKTVKLQELSQKMTVLEASIPHRAMNELSVQMLTAMKEDADILDIYAGDREEWIRLLDNRIAALQAEPEDIDNTYILRTYLNKRNSIVGISLLSMANTQQTEIFSCITVQDGKKLAQKFVLDNDLVMVGSCAVEQTLTGNYQMYYKGEDVCSIALTDCVIKGAKHSGSLQIIPSKQAVENLLKDIEPDIALIGVSELIDFKLDVCWEKSDSDTACDISLMAGDAMLLGITWDAAQKEPDPVQIPENYVDANSEEALQQWISGMKLEEFLSGFKQAGFPGLFLQDAESVLNTK